MRRPRSRFAIVAVLALAYPILLVGLGALGFVISATIAGDDESGEFADFNEGGALIATVLVVLPIVVLIAHLAWATLAGFLVPDRGVESLVSVTLSLAVAGIASFVFVGSGVGPAAADGPTRLLVITAALAGWGAAAAVWLARKPVAT